MFGVHLLWLDKMNSDRKINPQLSNCTSVEIQTVEMINIGHFVRFEYSSTASDVTRTVQFFFPSSLSF